MRQRFDIFLSALFCAFLGSICLLTLMLPKRSFSPLENRYLKKLPNLTAESVLNGSFMEDAEDYVSDHIAGRNGWVVLKAWSERLSGKHENNGVYFGTQNTLISRMEEPNMEQLFQNMGYVDVLTKNVSVPVYFGLIPTSAAVWSERLPANAPTADEQAIIERMYSFSGAKTIDFLSALDARKDEEIYYRTDHHWTSLGAFYGANALLDAMDLPLLVLENYQKTTVTVSFYGTAFSSSGASWIPPDCIDTYVPDTGIEVTSYLDGTPTEGSLYVDSYLSVKDKYSYFLGGRQPLCVIRTAHTDGPKLLLIRDSYSDTLSPFLTERFSEVHLFDARDNLTSIRDYVVQNDIDAVAVLYSLTGFIEGTNLFALGR